MLYTIHISIQASMQQHNIFLVNQKKNLFVYKQSNICQQYRTPQTGGCTQGPRIAPILLGSLLSTAPDIC